MFLKMEESGTGLTPWRVPNETESVRVQPKASRFQGSSLEALFAVEHMPTARQTQDFPSRKLRAALT